MTIPIDRSFLYLVMVIAIIAGCKSDPPQRPEPIIQSGEALAKQYCANCHMYPAPDLLDKHTWTNFVLIRMAAFMGIYHDGSQYVDQIPSQWVEPGIGGKRVQEANVYPTQAALSIEEWERIRDFYVQQAPSKLAATDPLKNAKAGIPNFTNRPFNQKRDIAPLIQSIHADASGHIYASEYNGGIYEFNSKGERTDFVPEESLIVSMHTEGEIFGVLDMASRYASDNPKGRITISNSFQDYKNNQHILEIKELMRPVHFDMSDQDEIIISEYGNLLGGLNLYNSASGNRIKSLFPDDGAVKAEFADLNADGHQDIIALQANSDEGIDWYLNDGNNNYQKERKLRFLPTNGSTHFSLIDYDRDGDLDLLYSNGDNGDYTPVLKPYHGIHLYLNEGGNYKKSWFIPHHGIYQSEALDFDQDGDMDIIGVSFHPDFKNSAESFVYYENNGQDEFKAYTIQEKADARWMRFITCDIDNDNDIDILLSAMNIKSPEVPPQVAEGWRAKNTAILLLENQLHP